MRNNSGWCQIKKCTNKKVEIQVATRDERNCVRCTIEVISIWTAARIWLQSFSFVSICLKNWWRWILLLTFFQLSKHLQMKFTMACYWLCKVLVLFNLNWPWAMALACRNPLQPIAFSFSLVFCVAIDYFILLRRKFAELKFYAFNTQIFCISRRTFTCRERFA